MVDNDKNQDLQPVFVELLRAATILKPSTRVFLSFPGRAGKASSSRWSRVESFVAEAASHICWAV